MVKDSDSVKKACCNVLGKLRKRCIQLGWECAVKRSKTTASIYIKIRHRKHELIELRVSNHRQSKQAFFRPTIRGKKCVASIMATLTQAHAHGLVSMEDIHNDN